MLLFDTYSSNVTLSFYIFFFSRWELCSHSMPSHTMPCSLVAFANLHVVRQIYSVNNNNNKQQQQQYRRKHTHTKQVNVWTEQLRGNRGGRISTQNMRKIYRCIVSIYVYMLCYQHNNLRPGKRERKKERERERAVSINAFHCIIMFVWIYSLSLCLFFYVCMALMRRTPQHIIRQRTLFPIILFDQISHTSKTH